jgi:hypothetical protein
MPWNECKPMDERLKFIARLLDGEKMAPVALVKYREYFFIGNISLFWHILSTSLSGKLRRSVHSRYCTPTCAFH